MEEEIKKEQEMNSGKPGSGEHHTEEEMHHGHSAHTETDLSKKLKKPVKKEDHTKELQAKIEELNDKYLRLYSEFDNYRKRTFKERGELIKTASEEIITSLLPVLDDLERAVKSINEIPEEKRDSALQGILLIYNKFRTLL